MEAKFYRVWHDPHLRQRIFYHARPPLDRANGDHACYLDYPEAIFYSPSKMQFTRWAMCWAAIRGNFVLIKWLSKNYPKESTVHVIDYAAANGHLEIIRWLAKIPDQKFTESAFYWASGNGHLEIIRWLKENYSCRDRRFDRGPPFEYSEVLGWFERHRTWLNTPRGV